MGFCTGERTQRKGEERAQRGSVSITKLQHRIVHQGLSFPIVVAPRFIKAQHVFTYFYPKLTEKALHICSKGGKKVCLFGKLCLKICFFQGLSL